MFHSQRAAGAALGAAAALCVATGVAAVEAAAPAAASKPVEATIQAAALVSDGVAAKPAGHQACPDVTLAPDGTSFPGRDDDYRATLEGLARDCANLGAETIVKIGFVGSGERDSKRGPSWFNAPVRLLVKDASGAAVETRRIPLKVTLPSGTNKVAFNHLEEDLSLPPAPEGYAGWSIVVGFDPSAAAASARPTKATRAAVVRRAVKVASRSSERVARVTRGARPMRAAARPRASRAQQAPQAPAPTPPPAPTASASPWEKLATEHAARQTRAQERAQQAQTPQRGSRPAPERQRPLARWWQPQAQPQPQAQATPAGPATLRTAEVGTR